MTSPYWCPPSRLCLLQHWLRWWLCAGQAISHYLNQWWSILLTHIFVTWTWWCHNLSWPLLVKGLQMTIASIHKDAQTMRSGSFARAKWLLFCSRHFQMHFFSMKIGEWLFEFAWILFAWLWLKISQHIIRRWPGAVMQQATDWTSADKGITGPQWVKISWKPYLARSH